MTDLTEQLKKGELPEGDYFITDGDEIYQDYFDNDKGFLKTYNYGVQKVLAPVPSYEEWQETLQALDAAHKAIKMEDETINRLVRSGKQRNWENARLKELLKECVEYVKKGYGDYLTYTQSAIYQEINQALGEDK